MAESGAVRVRSLEESRAVAQDLRRRNKLDRILPTKIARRYKPSEQPGTPGYKEKPPMSARRQGPGHSVPGEVFPNSQHYESGGDDADSCQREYVGTDW